MEEDIEQLKSILEKYRKELILFNEPHFTERLILREGNREEVIANILKPDRLVYSYQEIGKYGEIKHILHFKIKDNKTMILPIIINEKGLYIITYIMRYRSVNKKWQN